METIWNRASNNLAVDKFPKKKLAFVIESHTGFGVNYCYNIILSKGKNVLPKQFKCYSWQKDILIMQMHNFIGLL